jgi:hypothetical protein
MKCVINYALSENSYTFVSSIGNKTVQVGCTRMQVMFTFVEI